MSGANDFDFLLQPWAIHNRRWTNALYRDREHVEEVFEARHTSGGKSLDGRVVIDYF